MKRRRITLDADDAAPVEDNQDDSTDEDICERCMDPRKSHDPECFCGCKRFKSS